MSPNETFETCRLPLRCPFPNQPTAEMTRLTQRRSSGLLDDFIRECEHRGRDVARPRALAVASGDKEFAH